MTVTEEYLEWGTNKANPDSMQDGAYPRPGNTGHNVKIYYCFYQPEDSAKRDLQEIKRLVSSLEHQLTRESKPKPIAKKEYKLKEANEVAEKEDMAKEMNNEKELEGFFQARRNIETLQHKQEKEEKTLLARQLLELLAENVEAHDN